MHRDSNIRIVFALAALMMSASFSAAQSAQDQPTPATASALTLTNKDNAKTVQLAAGQMLVVQLAANPTTGYSWTVNGSPAPLELVKTDFVAHSGSNGRMGAGGTQSLQFVAKTGGTAKLALDYRRPWEKNTRPARKFSVTVDVMH